MIDPSFWEDEKLGTLEPMARLLFMGLISQADDDGRLKGHPSLLRSLIFPYDHEITLPQLDDWLNLLAAHDRRLIQRYDVDNQKYIFIRNFKKHQTINKPQKSKLPEPKEDYGIDTVTVNESYGNDTAQKKLIEGNLKESKEKLSEEEPQATLTTIYNAYRLYESEKFGIISSTIGDKIGHMIDDYTEIWVCKAMEEAVYYGKRYLPYVKTVLEQWTIKNHPEPWLLERDVLPQKSNVRHFNRSGSSGKQPLPMVQEGQKSAPLSDDKRAELMRMAELLDGDEASNH